MKGRQNFLIDFQHPDPIGAGFSLDGISRLEKSFQSQINAGLHPGAQLVVLRHGKVIVDLAAGSANLKKGGLSPGPPSSPCSPAPSLSLLSVSTNW